MFFHSAVKSSGGNIHAFIASGSRLLAPTENLVVCHGIILFLRLSQYAVFYIPPQHSTKTHHASLYYSTLFTSVCQVT